MADYKLLPYQEELKAKAEAFTKEYITPHAIELDKADEIPMELLQKAYKAGLMNMHVPKEAGGPGYTLFDETLVSEATGYGDSGVATAIMCNNLAFAPILLGGVTLEQTKKYITPLITGEKVKLAGFCLTEREAGSDAAATKTTAEKQGDEWVINGRKCWITNAPEADLFSVFVQTDASKGYKGLALFIVPKKDGVSIGHIENKLGQKASGQSEVIFENVHVPEDCLVGEIGKGFSTAMKTLDKTRAGIAAIATGVCQRCVDEASKFAITRKAFGKTISRFQGIGFMLADMQARAHTSRLLTRHAAWMADENIRNSTESAIAKYVSADNAMLNATDAIQVMGGYGYATEYGMGTIFRGAKLLQIYEGTNQIQRLVVMGNVLKRAKTLETGFKLDYAGVDSPDHTWAPQ